SYDALNRPVTITAPGGTQFQFTYDAAGRRTRMDMGAAVAAEYVYDAANQLTGITYRRKTDNAVIASVGYTYDNAGNRATMADDFGSHGFAYDDLHRLTSAVHPSSGALTTQSETFAYDAVGNRTSDAVRSGYAYDAANRLNSDSLHTYNYDNNGNLTAKTRASDNAQTTYVYDSQNRLTQVNLPSGYSETLRYDATGRRIAKTVTRNGETIREQHYIYDGEDIAFVTGADGALKAIYTHGPGTDEPLMLRKGASDYYLLADGLGSIIAIADQTGNIAERAQYQAYGKPVFRNEITASTSAWSQTSSLYSYTAREWDAETGLFYYRARYYAPDIGRFIQKDPVGYHPDYAYTNGNPVVNVDPMGTLTTPWGWIDMGEAQGQKSAEWYADQYNKSTGLDVLGYGLGGLLASLWTPCTSDKTATILSSALMASQILKAAGIPQTVVEGRKGTRIFQIRNTEGKPTFRLDTDKRGLHYHRWPDMNLHRPRDGGL
ncbi:MAG: RHS repeat-associated core domain-containing protein, partial [Elusimicrobiales bacterium]